MGLFSSKEFSTLKDLFVEQVEDLYDAEQRLVDALPDLVDAANSSELRSAFENHLTETKGHVSRLESVFKQLDMDPKRQSCEAMKGLIKESDAVVKAKGDPSVKDAALIAAAQRVEHYEIAGYGTARTFAQKIGRNDIAQTLQQTLDEEGNADRKLTEIAESFANERAANA